MSVFNRLAEEFNRGFGNIQKNLRLTSIPHFYFVRSEWETINPVPSWKFISWKLLYWLFITTTLIFVLWSKAVNDISTFKFFFIYFTNWTLILQTFFCTLHLGLLLYRRSTPSEILPPAHLTCKLKKAIRKREISLKETKTPTSTVSATPSCHSGANPSRTSSGSLILDQKCSKLESLLWLTWTMTSSLLLFVSFAFWTIVYNSHNEQFSPIFPIILTHGINGLFGLVDFFIVAIPVRVTHGFYTIFFCTIYGIFTFVYESIAKGEYEYVGQPYIYSALNWHEKSLQAAIALIFAATIIFVIHFVLWFLYATRIKLVICFSARSDKDRILDYHEYVDSSMNLVDINALPYAYETFQEGSSISASAGVDNLNSVNPPNNIEVTSATIKT